MYYPCTLLLEVYLENGYTGDYKNAISEALRIARKNECAVCLTYARQKYWIITPETTMQEMIDMQNEKFSIGV